MAYKIKTLLRCKHCSHDLEVAAVCGDRRVPLLWFSAASPQDVWDIFFLADAEAIKKEAREA